MQTKLVLYLIKNGRQLPKQVKVRFVTILTFLPGEYAKDVAQGGERRPTSRGHS